jgi:TIR domain
MLGASTKPVIFISYSHKDEPEKPVDGEVQWLTFVQTYLQPAAKVGIFELWADRNMPGGTDWDSQIERKLHECDVFILMVSAHSMASDYIINREIAIIRDRQAKGEKVHFYPLVLTPTPKAGLDKVRDKNLRPRDGKPLSGYAAHDRAQHMTDAANEIAELVDVIARQKREVLASQIGPEARTVQGVITTQAGRILVDIAHLPETAYERLVGREVELKHLDEAWVDKSTNILSLIAEGGAGKSALVNEWLVKLRNDNYRGAGAVLGWSFYSQGTKDRATSAEEFVDWALEKLNVTIKTTNPTIKGEAIAEAIARHRVLLVLDGVEPLQHGPSSQSGLLKDTGLRALLRRFAAVPPIEKQGLVLLSSRLAIEDIKRWRHSAAPVVYLEELSDGAGAALLRDNGIWGSDAELRATSRAFEGHPLALALLSGLLREKHFGDARHRDQVRDLLRDPEGTRHDHARRVMESYQSEWLSDQPLLSSILYMVGLFDRPASGDCLEALRQKPEIRGLTDRIMNIQNGDWQRAVVRLRDVRLLAPQDPSSPDSLDAHPLVREWFGERLKLTDETAWNAANGRLFEHLRDRTKDGRAPTLKDLVPLYQAITHGCKAGRYQEALDRIYINRICRRGPHNSIEFYASKKLGAVGSNLAALSYFFEDSYRMPIRSLNAGSQSWVIGQAAFALRAQGRFLEAWQALRGRIDLVEAADDHYMASSTARNLSDLELLMGDVSAATATAERSVAHAMLTHDEPLKIYCHATHADALHAAGQRGKARGLFAYVEERQRAFEGFRLLYSVRGFHYCDLLLASGAWRAVINRVNQIFKWEQESDPLLDRGLVRLSFARANLGLALELAASKSSTGSTIASNRGVHVNVDDAIQMLRAAGIIDFLSRGILTRAAIGRSIGDWNAAARDLDEVSEFVEPAAMRLYICDLVLERVRLAFARIEAFAPLNWMSDNSRSIPVTPDSAGAARLIEEAAANLVHARALIAECGYHRRDEELIELESVLSGKHKFADLPPRV